MAGKKPLSQRKQTIKQHADTFASVVIKAIVGWIAQKVFVALLASITQWLTQA
jgi:hypothetical protein